MNIETFMGVFKTLQRHGWYGLLVGGGVRDMVLGGTPKDIDVEVYGCTPVELYSVLQNIADGDVDEVGRSFGVFKCRIGGDDYDFSCPRRDNKVAAGHKGFSVEFDTSITPKEAASRRDFTMNAMAYDPLSREVLDFYGGQNDLYANVIRHTSLAFREDPLRVLRGMQFSGRFSLVPHWETVDLCRNMKDERKDLAPERVWGEWWKWATKSKYPSYGIEFLRATWWWLPLQIRRLVGVEQDPEWHPEGSVYDHTLLAVDAAAEIADNDGLEGEERAVLIFAALCHDFGKPTCTEISDEGRIISPGHAEYGAHDVLRFMQGVGAPEHITDQVVTLTKEHMAHLSPPTARNVRRLAARLSPVTVEQWSRVVIADHSARGGRLNRPTVLDEFMRIAKEQDVERQKSAPILMGRHLIGLCFSPAPWFGDVLREAYEAQLDGEFDSLDGAIEWAKAKLFT